MENFVSFFQFFWNMLAGAVNWGLIYRELPNLSRGAAASLFITTFSVSIGVVMGLGIAIMRLSRRGIFRYPAIIYIEILRGTPMLVQILLIYYGVFPGLHNILDKLGVYIMDFQRLPAIYSGILALGFNSGAYLGEIFRGGIQSIDRGQREAALSLGMNEYQVMRYVVLPQALVNALPAIGNEFITMVKDTSLVSIIAVSELTYRANLVAARTYEYFTMYVGIGLVYLVMNITLSRLLAWIEKRLRVGQTDSRVPNQKRGRSKVKKQQA